MTSVRPGGRGPDGETLSESEYRRLAAFIHARSGISLAPSKKAMLEGRLRRRVRELGLGSVSSYCRFLFEDGFADDEEPAILDVVTTKKTDFFRERHHFQFLAEVALPGLFRAGIGAARPLRLWSAGCSNGAEPYSIAMVCQEFADQQPSFRFEVLATDISIPVLQVARRAVYPHAMVEAVPLEVRRRYLLRTMEGDSDEVRIAPELRRRVEFGYFNLISESAPPGERTDVLFCRNVLIYFDKSTRQAVLSRLCRQVAEGGYLILGHSESVAGLSLPLQSVAPTVFVRVGSP